MMMDFAAADGIKEFIDLTVFNVFFLITLGFFGGLISGFIGSGGAFVLTPGMMNLGASAPVAVASNMCHKFPKALVGSYKRHKYGQLDVKLGLVIGVSAVAGVQLGIRIQEMLIDRWGEEAGSNLYVSSVFVVILVGVGGYMLRDLLRSRRVGGGSDEMPALAKRVQSIRLSPMIKLKGSDRAVSVWATIPVGFCTGLLAATIAVGGFVGVPGMIYILGVAPIMASATELSVAFLMGLTGVITWALDGYVDIRMTLLILAGSLFGVQIGAIGTTYVRDYVIKFVMVALMLMVAVSRSVVLPTYLSDLGSINMSHGAVSILKDCSFGIMCMALGVGGLIVLGSMGVAKRRMSYAPVRTEETPPAPIPKATRHHLASEPMMPEPQGQTGSFASPSYKTEKRAS